MNQKNRTAEIFVALLAGVLVVFLTQCTPSGGPSTGGGSADAKPDALALSPGMQISSLVSGGIAGLNDSIQVSNDWNLIVVRRSESFVRRLDGEEQAALRQLLNGFASLSYGQSDGADVADGMSSTLHARGHGTGSGTSADALTLFDILNAAAEKKVSD